MTGRGKTQRMSGRHPRHDRPPYCATLGRLKKWNHLSGIDRNRQSGMKADREAAEAVTGRIQHPH
jgi:hypothetical protein